MVQVKLKISRSGVDGAFSPGDVISVSTAEAQRMVDAGQCDLVRSKKPTKAIRSARAEKAVK